MENQSKQKNKDFIENLKNLLENSPEGCEFFLSAKLPNDENKKNQGVTACSIKTDGLSEVLAVSITQVPILKKQFELALILATVETDPLRALKDLFSKFEAK